MHENKSQTIRIENGEAGFNIYSQIREGTLTNAEMQDGRYQTQDEARKDLTFQRRILTSLRSAHRFNAFLTASAIIVDVANSLGERGDQHVNQTAFLGFLFILGINAVVMNTRIGELKRVRNKISASEEAIKQGEPDFKRIYPL